MSYNAIIVGAPRSGTSLTATFFKNSGYFVTEDETTQLQQASEFNPHGFWEAEALKQCNREILNAAGFPYDNTWLGAAITEQQASSISTLPHAERHRVLVESFSGREPWLWKDPCLCYTLGYWWPLIKEHNTKVILLKRDPEEIYQSFLRLKWSDLNGDDKQAAFRRIEHHMAFAEKIVAQFDIPHIVVDYSDYENRSALTAKRVGDFFVLTLSEKDIGFDKKLNSSSIRGRFSRLLDRFFDLMPSSARKLIKKMTPTFILKMIFPHR